MLETESFRDHIPTVSADGKSRQWMYPKLIKGKLYQYRNMVSWLLLGLLFSGPFIRLNGEQLILFNVLERKFVFFGVIFLPQDFYLFVLAMLTFMVFIVLFTVVFGRVFCGWACPQTIFMEMVFRKIERWIEGTPEQQRKLNAAPLSIEKALKKGGKFIIFVLISFFIANIFLAYLTGTENLLQIMAEPISQHTAGFIAIWIFTAVFYLVFANLRELVCTVICPYGRLQGVLLDKESLLVAYDYVRGEPRGKKGSSLEKLGDCVDCGLCVQVCPTGIDIRNGTQLECINCTVCIDACDMVMHKLDREERLIGFNSEMHISQNQKFKITKRIYGYAAVLLVLLSVLSVLIFRRTAIETTVLRAVGTLYQLRDDGTVSNLYNAELVNKTSQTMAYELKSANPKVRIEFISKPEELKKGEAAKITFFVFYPQKEIKKYKTDISFEIISGNKLVDEVETTFIAPPNQ